MRRLDCSPKSVDFSLGGKLSGAAREFGILELSLGRGGIFWYQLLTDEVLTLTVIASGLRAGSLLRAAE